MSLPVIDIASFVDENAYDEGSRQACVDALRASAKDKAFFQLTGHGIPHGLMDDMLEQSRRFFALPQAEKDAISVELAPARNSRRGYEVMGGQMLEADTKPDLKEGFLVGVERPLDDPRVQEGRINQGPNQWPRAGLLPEFRARVTEYHSRMLLLGALMMKVIARSLDLPDDYFAAFDHDAIGTLRLLHYPPQPADADARQRGAGAHTDFGALTFLMQDSNGGLQVRDYAADTWVDVAPLPHVFVVNLGDAMARWTGHTYNSTLHRVINRSGRERYSIPFFYNGNPDHIIHTLPTCIPLHGAEAYAPVTVEEHLRHRYQETYGRISSLVLV